MQLSKRTQFQKKRRKLLCLLTSKRTPRSLSNKLIKKLKPFKKRESKLSKLKILSKRSQVRNE